MIARSVVVVRHDVLELNRATSSLSRPIVLMSLSCGTHSAEISPTDSWYSRICRVGIGGAKFGRSDRWCPADAENSSPVRMDQFEVS